MMRTPRKQKSVHDISIFKVAVLVATGCAVLVWHFAFSPRLERNREPIPHALEHFSEYARPGRTSRGKELGWDLEDPPSGGEGESAPLSLLEARHQVAVLAKRLGATQALLHAAESQQGALHARGGRPEPPGCATSEELAYWAKPPPAGVLRVVDWNLW